MEPRYTLEGDFLGDLKNGEKNVNLVCFIDGCIYVVNFCCKCKVEHTPEEYEAGVCSKCFCNIIIPYIYTYQCMYCGNRYYSIKNVDSSHNARCKCRLHYADNFDAFFDETNFPLLLNYINRKNGTDYGFSTYEEFYEDFAENYVEYGFYNNGDCILRARNMNNIFSYSEKIRRIINTIVPLTKTQILDDAYNFELVILSISHGRKEVFVGLRIPSLG